MTEKISWMMKAAVLVAAMLLAGIAPVRAQNDGAALFKAKCAACHGPDGKGDTSMGKMLKARDLSSDDVQKQTDEQLTEITENGKNKMPAYKGKLTDAQIKELIAFIRTLRKK